MFSEKSKAKILFIVPLPPPVHGASLRNLSLIESKLINATFTIRVIPFNFAVETNDIGKFSIIKVWKAIQRSFSILYTMFVFRPDMVYFNLSLYGFALYRDVVYAMLLKMFNSKLIYHLRTQGVKKQIIKSNFKKNIFKFIFKKTNIICLSEYLCADVADVYVPKPIVVNNGIEDVSNRFYKKNSREGAPVTILFLSNFARTKGVLEFIESLKILKSKNIKFNALIVGNPLDLSSDYLQEMVNGYGLSGEVKVSGSKHGDDKYNIFNNADIFVLPTYFEAFPGSILEAMQFGLPVVSTFEGAIPEIVENGVTGLLVEKQNVKELSEKIEQLIRNPDLRLSMGNKGREKFLRSYTLTIFERKMNSVFKTILSES
jgi:glycosyltransferase involved in cell wall biosynthesis